MRKAETEDKLVQNRFSHCCFKWSEFCVLENDITCCRKFIKVTLKKSSFMQIRIFVVETDSSKQLLRDLVLNQLQLVSRGKGRANNLVLEVEKNNTTDFISFKNQKKSCLTEKRTSCLLVACLGRTAWRVGPSLRSFPKKISDYRSSSPGFLDTLTLFPKLPEKLFQSPTWARRHEPPFASQPTWAR